MVLWQCSGKVTGPQHEPPVALTSSFDYTGTYLSMVFPQAGKALGTNPASGIMWCFSLLGINLSVHVL